MKNTARQIFFYLTRTSFVRLMVRGVLLLIGSLGRFCSRLRFAALVKHCPSSSVCHWSTQIKMGGNIKIGEHVTISPFCVLGAKSPITIGDHVRIARGAVIETGGADFDAPPPFPHISKPIVIEDGVCIYSNAVILGGVTVGRFSVVGAGCVISRDVPPFTIVVQAARVELSRRPSVRKKLGG